MWAAEVRPRRRDLKRDLLAGVPSAIAAVPDGMANGVLAGVSPIQGLYASLVGRVAGGIDRQHQDDGDHHHERGGLGCGFGHRSDTGQLSVRMP